MTKGTCGPLSNGTYTSSKHTLQQSCWSIYCCCDQCHGHRVRTRSKEMDSPQQQQVNVSRMVNCCALSVCRVSTWQTLPRPGTRMWRADTCVPCVTDDLLTLSGRRMTNCSTCSAVGVDLKVQRRTDITAAVCVGRLCANAACTNSAATQDCAKLVSKSTSRGARSAVRLSRRKVRHKARGEGRDKKKGVCALGGRKKRRKRARGTTVRSLLI